MKGVRFPVAGFLVLGMLVFAADSFAWDKIALPNGEFQAKKPTEGFRLKGRDAVVEAIGPDENRALRAKAGTELSFAFTLPAPPKAEGVDEAEWYGRITCDVLGLEGKGRMEWALLREKKRKPVMTKRIALNSKSIDGEVTRLEWLIPAKRLQEWVDEPLTLRVECKASGRFEVILDGFAFERFHPTPNRKLLGKPNGKLGPDWLASGALGLHGITVHQSRAFSVAQVRKGGPAEKAGVRIGDVVIAVDGVPLAPSSIAPGWDWFEASHEARLGRALEQAWADGASELGLTVLRDEKHLTLRLAPAVLAKKKWKDRDELLQQGPLDPALRADLIAWVAKHQKKNGGWPKSDVVNAALGGLALLGTRDKAHRQAIDRCQAFLLKKNPKPSEMRGLAYWSIAFHGWFFAEHYLATGDEQSLAWVREAVEWLPTTTHESKWGTQAFGHGPDGLPYDDKALTAPAAHLLVLDALARRCGIESQVWEHIQPYMEHAWSDPANDGHGGMGYNGSFRDQGEFWSRSGLTALAEHLRGGDNHMRRALTALMAERHPWMLNSHAYGEPGCALGLLGLAVVHPSAFAEILPQYRWRFLNAWEPGYGLRWSTPHMGSPYMGEDEIMNLSYAFLSALQNQGLVMAGGEAERWLR